MDLTHTILYIKGSYKKDDLLLDLNKTIRADGYAYSKMSYKMIAELLLTKCSGLRAPAFNDMVMFGKAIMPSRTSDYGYTHSESLFRATNELPYDIHKAIVYYLLSNLIWILNDEWDSTKKPNPEILPLNEI